MPFVDGVKRMLKMCGHAFTITVHDRLESMERRQTETDNVLLRASVHLAEQVRRSGRYEVLAAEDPKNFHPTVALIRHLYSMFSSPSARVMPCAAASQCSDAIEWTRELAGMGYKIEETSDPSPAILLVCGTFDPGNLRPAVVIADLDAGAENRVAAMRSLGYRWHLVLGEPSASGEAGKFYANYPVVLPEWRGNAIFFRDHAMFFYALQWCEAVLRQMYFGPAEEGD
jgi:hypothetical protein